ncbi:MAG: J domain-containing protein [Acidobacteria bacterium]|nr:J domain-containing protein [Acidobacteriota bacterium]
MAKNHRDFLSGYKRYDPDAEGFGSPKQWRGEFRSTMGFEEAEEVLRAAPGNTPLGILGLPKGATWNQIKSAYKKMARLWHPDINAAPDATEQMKKINAAYVILERQYGK